MKTIAILFLASASGAGLAAAAGNLTLNDSLNNYQLYGKDFVRIEGDAETSQDGAVGSDKLVDFTNLNVKINGNLTSGGDVTTKSNVDVAGYVNVRGDLTFIDDNNEVFQWMNVGGKMSILGGNPMANVFHDSMYIGTSPISVAGWASNTYIGKVVTGAVNGGNRPPQLLFGINKAFPSTNMPMPDTVANFDASKPCTTPASTTFNMSMCGLGGSAADSILPPGRYGDWVIASGNRIYLTSGTYHFRSLYLMSDGTRFLFTQPGGGTTRVLIQGDFTVCSGDNLIAPTRYTDPSFKAGTVLIYVNGAVSLNDDNKIWATVAAPKSAVVVETGLRLFGQIFGKSIFVQNGFKGGTGFGRYIPLKKPGGFKYSVIHFQHKD